MSMWAACCRAITSATATATAASSAVPLRSPASNRSTTGFGRGRLPVWVVRIRSVLRRMWCPRLRRALKQVCGPAARQVGDAGADSHQRPAEEQTGRHPPGEALMRHTFEPVAGNGLLDRRLLLRRGLAFAGAAAGVGATGAAAEPLQDAPWSREQGRTSVAIEQPSKYEDGVKRI